MTNRTFILIGTIVALLASIYFGVTGNIELCKGFGVGSALVACAVSLL